MIKAGDTFVWRGNARKRHLYIAMNDGAAFGGRVAVLNITESVGGSASFVLRKGDHPYIYKNSDVNFGDAFIVDENLLDAQVKCGEAVPDAKMDGALLRKIAEAAAKHPAPPNEVKKIIKTHWKILI